MLFTGVSSAFLHFLIKKRGLLMGIYEELEERGIIAQCTDKEKVKNLLNNEKVFFYIGFDPTADCLHVGHFVQILIISRLQKFGHIPIVLFGGGTAMVGDPSGKTDMRKMLTNEQINHNISCFKRQAEKFIDFSNNKAIMLNNSDWLKKLNYIEFLRDIGVHFSVNRMLAAECYKSRLESGLTFFELNYMIMQSYDFLYLNQKHNCQIQFGGDDQWSNIIGGVELIRKVSRKEAFGLTFSLLTKSDGQKMGKTEKGAIWLDPNKTSPFNFYQYWRNVDDKDVIKCMKMLTFMTLDEIKSYESLQGEEINKAKQVLAFEVTKLVHGENEAIKVENAAKSVFSAKHNSDDMPSCSICENDLNNGKINILDLLLKMDLAPSKSEARRLISQGGISVDNEKVLDISTDIGKDAIKRGLIVKKGKKIYKKAIFS